MIDIDKTVRELIEELNVEATAAGDDLQSSVCHTALGYLSNTIILPLEQPWYQELAIRKCLKVISEGGER